MPAHIVIRQAASQCNPAIQQMAVRQAGEWDAIVIEIGLLSPGAPTAEVVLRRAANLLASIVTNYGPIHGWLLSQRHLIYREATRLLGAGQTAFNQPGWREDY